MAAVEAVARIIRTGGDAGRTLERLSADARAALESLRRLNPEVDSALRSWSDLRAKMAGGELTPEQAKRFSQLGRDLAERANQAARALPTGAPPAPGPTAAPAVPAGATAAGTPAPSVPTPASTKLTPEQRESLRDRYTDSDLGRATWLTPPTDEHPGTLFVPQEVPRPAPAGPPRAVPAAGPAGPKPEREWPALTPWTAEKLAEEEAAISSRVAADREQREAPPPVETAAEKAAANMERRRRARLLQDAELGEHLARQGREVEELTREIESQESALGALNRTKEHGGKVDGEQVRATEQRLRQLQDERRESRQTQLALEREAHERGFRLVGSQMLRPGERPRRPDGDGSGDQSVAMLRQFVSGSGIGGMGGGGGNLLMSMAGGLMSVQMAIAATAAATAAYMIQQGRENFGVAVSGLQSSIPAEIQSGGDPADAYSRNFLAARQSDRLMAFPPLEILRAQRQAAAAYGGADVDVASLVALLMGQRPGEQVGAVIPLMQRARRADEFLSGRMLYEFRQGDIAAGKQSLPYQFAGFQSGVGAVMAATTSPLTPTDPADVAGQLARFRAQMVLPGVDFQSPAHMQAATAGLQSISAFYNSMGSQRGPLGDMALLAMRNLRGSDAADRLAEQHGIDLSTPVGMMRAASRASQLATGPNAVPEVIEALGRTLRDFYPEQQTRELALNASGMDFETIAMMRSMDERRVFRPAQYNVSGPEIERALMTDAAEMTGRGDATSRGSAARLVYGDVYERTVREEAQRMSNLSSQDIGGSLQRIENDVREYSYGMLDWASRFSDRVVDHVTDLWQSTLQERAQ